jgi:hypothetical protein
MVDYSWRLAALCALIGTKAANKPLMTVTVAPSRIAGGASGSEMRTPRRGVGLRRAVALIISSPLSCLFADELHASTALSSTHGLFLSRTKKRRHAETTVIALLQTTTSGEEI